MDNSQKHAPHPLGFSSQSKPYSKALGTRLKAFTFASQGRTLTQIKVIWVILGVGYQGRHKCPGSVATSACGQDEAGRKSIRTGESFEGILIWRWFHRILWNLVKTPSPIIQPSKSLLTAQLCWVYNKWSRYVLRNAFLIIQLEQKEASNLFGMESYPF